MLWIRFTVFIQDTGKRKITALFVLCEVMPMATYKDGFSLRFAHFEPFSRPFLLVQMYTKALRRSNLN